MQGEVTDLRVAKREREGRARPGRLDAAWSLPPGPHPTGVEMFEKQVELGPNRPAVRSGDQEASYHE